MPESATAASITVGEVGEDAILAAIARHLPRGERTALGPGDDAALLRGESAATLVTCDVLVEERHFSLRWSTGFDVGWRSAMQNLADIAAMGGVPTALVVGLAMPSTTPLIWVDYFAQGLAAACRGAGPQGGDVGVVGGDLTSAESVVIAVTALGEPVGPVVTRGGAAPGEIVALAGTLGRSAAGLALLMSGATTLGAGGNPPGELLRLPLGDPLDERRRDAYRRGTDAFDASVSASDAIAAYLRPISPLQAGPAAAGKGASAMMDVSDGLARDAGRMAAASGVVIDLERRALAPAVLALTDVAAAVGADPWQWVLGGGEDHGLLATFGPDDDEREHGDPARALPTGFVPIGRVRAEDAGPRVRLDGEAWHGSGGWDHFAGPAVPASGRL